MSRWRGAAALAAMFLAGCSAPKPATSPFALVFLTVANPQAPVLMTKIEGTLGLHGQCLALMPDGGGPAFIVVWPHGYQAAASGGDVVVDGPHGARAALGARLALVGGPWEDSAENGKMRARIDAMTGQHVPDGCDTGHYWVGGIDS